MNEESALLLMWPRVQDKQQIYIYYSSYTLMQSVFLFGIMRKDKSILRPPSGAENNTY